MSGIFRTTAMSSLFPSKHGDVTLWGHLTMQEWVILRQCQRYVGPTVHELIELGRTFKGYFGRPIIETCSMERKLTGINLAYVQAMFVRQLPAEVAVLGSFPLYVYREHADVSEEKWQCGDIDIFIDDERHVETIFSLFQELHERRARFVCGPTAYTRIIERPVIESSDFVMPRDLHLSDRLMERTPAIEMIRRLIASYDCLEDVFLE